MTELESQVKIAQTELDTVSKGYDADEIDEAQKNLDAVKSQLNDADNQLAKLKMSEASYNQADVTASYKEWTQAATEYAQNQHDINDLTTKIADTKAMLKQLGPNITATPEVMELRKWNRNLRI